MYFCSVSQENVSLIKEINDLRRELKIARTQVHDLEAALGVNKKNKNLSDSENDLEMNGEMMTFTSREGKTEENVRIIEMQKGEIRKLRGQLQEAEHFMVQRPSSGSKLPPVLAN